VTGAGVEIGLQQRVGLGGREFLPGGRRRFGERAAEALDALETPGAVHHQLGHAGDRGIGHQFSHWLQCQIRLRGQARRTRQVRAFGGQRPSQRRARARRPCLRHGNALVLRAYESAFKHRA